MTPTPTSNLAVGLHAFVRGNPSEVLSATSGIGARWIELLADWSELEPQPENYQWQHLDDFLRAAQAKQIQVLLRIDFAPSWAGRGEASHAIPRTSQLYATFVGHLVARYRPGSLYGEVAAVQLWNEPNLAQDWGGFPIDSAQAAEFSSVFRDGARAAHQANPRVIVVLPGLAPTGVIDPAVAQPADVYLNWLYANGAAESADAIGVHSYGSLNPPEADPTVIARDPAHGGNPTFSFRYAEILHQVADAHDDTRPFWITEFGWTSDPITPSWRWQRVSEPQKADYLVRAFQYANAHWPWVGPMFIWNLPDPSWNANDEQYWFGIRGPSDLAYQALHRAALHGVLPGAAPVH